MTDRFWADSQTLIIATRHDTHSPLAMDLERAYRTWPAVQDPQETTEQRILVTLEKILWRLTVAAEAAG